MNEEILRMILRELENFNEHLAEIADTNANSIKLLQDKLDEKLENVKCITKEVNTGHCCGQEVVRKKNGIKNELV